MFKFGQMRPKTREGVHTRTKSAIDSRPKRGRDNDSIMAEGKNDANRPSTEKASMQGGRPNGNKAFGIGMHIWITVTCSGRTNGQEYGKADSAKRQGGFR